MRAMRVRAGGCDEKMRSSLLRPTTDSSRDATWASARRNSRPKPSSTARLSAWNSASLPTMSFRRCAAVSAEPNNREKPVRTKTTPRATCGDPAPDRESRSPSRDASSPRRSATRSHTRTGRLNHWAKESPIVCAPRWCPNSWATTPTSSSSSRFAMANELTTRTWPPQANALTSSVSSTPKTKRRRGVPAAATTIRDAAARRRCSTESGALTPSKRVTKSRCVSGTNMTTEPRAATTMNVANGGSNGIEATSHINAVAVNHAGSNAMTGNTAVMAVVSNRRCRFPATRPRLDTALSTLTR